MRFEQLEYLLEVGNTNSIAKASKKLHTSAQNISYALKTLEEELNVKIFERSASGFLLTTEGRKVKRMAADIVNKAHALQTLYNPVELAVDYTICEDVYCLVTPTFSHCILGLIYLLKPMYPQITFHLTELDADKGWKVLRENPNRYQIALLEVMENGSKTGRLHPYYKCTLIKESQMAFIAAPQHPLSKVGRPSLSAVEKYPVVFFSDNEQERRNMYYTWLMSQGYRPNILLFTNSTSAYFAAIASGRAIGTISEYVYRSNVSNSISTSNILAIREKVSIYHLLMTSRRLTPAGKILLADFQALFEGYDAQLIDIDLE